MITLDQARQKIMALLCPSCHTCPWDKGDIDELPTAHLRYGFWDCAYPDCSPVSHWRKVLFNLLEEKP